MTTKVRIEGVTIETTGELEQTLLERILEYLISRHSGTIVTPLTPEEIEAVREELQAGDEEKQRTTEINHTREIDRIIEDFARRHAEADRLAERTIGRPHTYPRVGVTGEKIEGPRTGVTIGEALVASGQIPEHWVTGIKIGEDGVKRYKTHYKCPCGHHGNHYIPLGFVYCKCHNCGAMLKIEPATAEGFPNRDDRGNYFVAREVWNEAVTSDESGGSDGAELPERDESTAGTSDAVELAATDGQ